MLLHPNIKWHKLREDLQDFSCNCEHDSSITMLQVHIIENSSYASR